MWAIHEDSDGGLWFGTRNNGLFRWRQNKLTHYTTAQGLASNSIYQILEDQKGSFWMSGVDAIRTIRKKHPHACFVVPTTYEGDEDIFQALEAGARGYIIKGMPHEALVDALHKVHSGGRFLPLPVSRALESRTPSSDLSPRGREVQQLLARGESNKMIALHLGISEATVKCHVSVILLRLQVEDRTQAVVAAFQRGLVHI